LNFIDFLTPKSDVDAEWKSYIDKQKIIELDKIIEEENLKNKKLINL
jgi:hypothetical protein